MERKEKYWKIFTTSGKCGKSVRDTNYDQTKDSGNIAKCDFECRSK